MERNGTRPRNVHDGNNVCGKKHLKVLIPEFGEILWVINEERVIDVTHNSCATTAEEEEWWNGVLEGCAALHIPSAMPRSRPDAVL